MGSGAMETTHLGARRLTIPFEGTDITSLPSSFSGDPLVTRHLLAFLLLLAATQSLSAAPQALVSTEFGTAATLVKSPRQVTGMLPDGWDENSDWNPEIFLKYQPLTEKGQSYLRVSKLSVAGRGQMDATLPALTEETFLGLDFTARSPDHLPLEIGVRQVGPPYAFVSVVRPTLGSDWKPYHFEMRIGAQAQPVGLWIDFADRGSYDLRDLSLRSYPKEDLIAAMKAAHPGGDTGNLVRNSRFPLGIQSGWSIDREVSDGDVVTLTPDEAVIGPSGAPALRIDTPVMTRNYTAPVAIPWSFMQHTASLFLRGDASGRLVIIGDGRELASQPFNVHGTDWQRVQVTFAPVFRGEIHSVRIDGKGRFWVDALQVEAGPAARPYASPMAREVALGLPESDASSARVQFEDEPAVVRFCVTGTSSGILKASVINVYGDRKDLPPVAIGAAFRQDGTLRYDVFADRPYGPFRIEARVENAQGQDISPPNELVVFRLRRPRYWGKDAPDSPFGVHTDPNTRHLLMAKAVGVNWVRLHDAGAQFIGWSFLEPAKGQWTFFDKDIERYRTYHLKILGMLETAPGWATNWKKPATAYFERFMEPLDQADFANYVRTVTARYKGVIDSYEVWNEPWGALFMSYDFDEKQGKTFEDHFVRGKTPEADYARLMHTAYTAAKEVDPTIRILGFNSTSGDSGRNWTKGILDAGGLQSCDAFSYHHYTTDFNGGPDDSAAKAYADATGPIVAAKGAMPLPVWMSEGDVLQNGLNFGMYHYTTLENPGDDNIGAANRLARYMVSHRALGEVRTFLYSMHAQDYFAPTPQEWSTLVTSEGYLHPSAAAHSALAWLLEDTRFVKLGKLADGVYAYYFQGKSRAVAVLSTETVHAPFMIPHAKGIAVVDLFGNPIMKPAPLLENLVYLSNSGDLKALERVFGG